MDNAVSIGNSAFNFCDSLKSVYLPPSMTSIDKSPFSSVTTIIGYTGTYAEKFAKEYGLHFEPIKTDDTYDEDEDFDTVVEDAGTDAVVEDADADTVVEDADDDVYEGSDFSTGTVALLCGGCAIIGALVSALATTAILKKKKKEE